VKLDVTDIRRFGPEIEDEQIKKLYRETGTVPRDLFEAGLERAGNRGFLSRRILKSLLEPIGLWKLFTREEVEYLSRGRDRLLFPYTIQPGRVFEPTRRFTVEIWLRPVFMVYAPDGPDIRLHAY